MTEADVANAVSAALDPPHFFAAAGHRLRFVDAAPERCAWELFRGHLLDRSQTRQARDFTSWHVFLDDADEPLLSVKYDSAERRLYVVRSLRILGQEAFEQAGVIDSRPVEKWHRELVGSVAFGLAGSKRQVLALLEQTLFLAVVGTSRLPITSLESPLPQFSLGRLMYSPTKMFGPAPAPTRNPIQYLEGCWSPGSPADYGTKLLEFALRSVSSEDLPELRRAFLRHWQSQFRPMPPEAWRSCNTVALLALNQSLFQSVALSPYTDFVDRWLSFLEGFVSEDCVIPGPLIGLFGYFLRHLARHLTAFDLRTFHNRGANYPDALFLDAALRAYLRLLHAHPEAVGHRLLGRALLMGWLARKELEGLPVPERPTSPGENLRILPSTFPPVPEEQLHDPRTRTRQLFADEPAEELLDESTRSLLRECLEALNDPRELRELGMAVFLDRPLGAFKQPGEVDRTSLFSHEAFSRQIARRRLDALFAWGLLSAERRAELAGKLETLAVRGFPAKELNCPERPGVVSLADAVKASPDFVFIRTTASSLEEFRRDYNWEGLARAAPELLSGLQGYVLEQERLRTNQPVLLVPRSDPGAVRLVAYDENGQARLEFSLSPPVEYLELAGKEYVARGLHIRSVDPDCLLSVSMRLPPKFD